MAAELEIPSYDFCLSNVLCALSTPFGNTGLMNLCVCVCVQLLWYFMSFRWLSFPPNCYSYAVVKHPTNITISTSLLHSPIRFYEGTVSTPYIHTCIQHGAKKLPNLLNELLTFLICTLLLRKHTSISIRCHL